MNRIACQISSGSPSRRSGTGLSTFSSISGRIASTIGVRIKPGAIAPVRMP